MNRYEFNHGRFAGEPTSELDLADDGEWVRYDDVRVEIDLLTTALESISTLTDPHTSAGRVIAAKALQTKDSIEITDPHLGCKICGYSGPLSAKQRVTPNLDSPGYEHVIDGKRRAHEIQKRSVSEKDSAPMPLKLDNCVHGRSVMEKCDQCRMRSIGLGARQDNSDRFFKWPQSDK